MQAAHTPSPSAPHPAHTGGKTTYAKPRPRVRTTSPIGFSGGAPSPPRTQRGPRSPRGRGRRFGHSPLNLDHDRLAVLDPQLKHLASAVTVNDMLG